MGTLGLVLAQSIEKSADGTITWLGAFARTAIGVAIVFIVLAALAAKGSSSHLLKVGIKIVIALALIGGLAAWIAAAATNDIQTKGSMPPPVYVDTGTGV